jgi:hypothetical protein
VSVRGMREEHTKARTNEIDASTPKQQQDK